MVDCCKKNVSYKGLKSVFWKFKRKFKSAASRACLSEEHSMKRVLQCSRNPPTPALAKAGAAPGTTAGVELVFLSNRHPKATSMASYGRPSLPFASP